jgi:hypothetical protein
MILSLLAGAGALFDLYQPRMAPTMALPGSKGSLLTALGAIAAVATVLTAFVWLSYITAYLVDIDVIQFVIGLIAAVVLAWSGWQILRSEGGKFRFVMPTPTPAAPQPPASTMAETPMAETPMAETPMTERPMAEAPMSETPPNEEPPSSTPG